MPTDTTNHDHSRAQRLLATIGQALQLAPQTCANVRFTDADELPSVFAVTDFAAASVAAAGAALAEWVAAHTGQPPALTVGRRLASLWFGRPRGSDR